MSKKYSETREALKAIGIMVGWFGIVVTVAYFFPSFAVSL